MKVNVAFSGRWYVLGQQRNDMLDLPDGASVDDALDALRRDPTASQCLAPSALLVISGEHIGTIAHHLAQPLEEADELYIFAPVAGG